jgi:hypothetical protein
VTERVTVVTIMTAANDRDGSGDSGIGTEKSAVVTEKAAAVYQRGRWLVSNISDVRIMWNITLIFPRGRYTGMAITHSK